MKNLRKEFPVLSQYTYLNTASSGIMYDSLLEFRHRHDLDFLSKGSLFRDTQAQFLKKVKQTIATTFNGDDQRIALMQNFSLGFNTVLNGLAKNTKFLLVQSDYPSVNFAVISKGFTHCFAEGNLDIENNILEKIKKEKPDVLAVSMVQYLDGIALQPSFFKELKKIFPDLFMIVDGSQFMGTQSFDFENSGIDILGTTGYKWMLGGYGSGFFMFSKEAIEKVTPQSYIEAASVSNYDTSYTQRLSRFECGSMDTLSFGSLQHSLHFLQQIGWECIEQKIDIVSTYAKERLTDLNLLSPHVIARNYHSSIFTIKGDVNIYHALKKHGIITTLRSNGIRTSFHFYNTKNDVDQLVKVLSPSINTTV